VRFGSRVTLFDQADRLLTNDDPDASHVVQGALTRDGVQIVLGAIIASVSHRDGKTFLQFRRGPDGSLEEAIGDRLLVAAGRTPNVDGLNLSRAGIDAGPEGVGVDDRLRTGNRRVYAAGDVCSRFRFTHVADVTARIVIQSALFFGCRKASALTETEGFVRVHHERGRLLGCTIVAAHAGDLIGRMGAAIARGTTLSDLAATVYPYPTQAEALRKAGDAYRRTLLTPRVRRIFERYFRMTRW
jgi:pyruvate/2-oxoglutarate dehydrogenase complex dihydrolipoamide dehydrogenase (E3) component